MTRRRMTVDPGCADLAERFLSDLSGATAEDIADLAEAIQRACEDACRHVEDADRDRADLASAVLPFIAMGAA